MRRAAGFAFFGRVFDRRESAAIVQSERLFSVLDPARHVDDAAEASVRREQGVVQRRACVPHGGDGPRGARQEPSQGHRHRVGRGEALSGGCARDHPAAGVGLPRDITHPGARDCDVEPVVGLGAVFGEYHRQAEAARNRARVNDHR
jgi:hypothetical protein